MSSVEVDTFKRPLNKGKDKQKYRINMDIYVGNLAYSTTDDLLQKLFAEYGTVSSARVCIDRMSGRSKGFGFVEMPTAAEAQAAIDAINGREIDGRALRVNESQPKPREERRSFGGGNGGGGERRGGGSERRGGGGGSRW